MKIIKLIYPEFIRQESDVLKCISEELQEEVSNLLQTFQNAGNLSTEYFTTIIDGKYTEYCLADEHGITALHSMVRISGLDIKVIDAEKEIFTYGLDISTTHKFYPLLEKFIDQNISLNSILDKISLLGVEKLNIKEKDFLKKF